MLEIVKIVFAGGFLLIEGIRDLKKRRVSLKSVFLFAIMGILLQIPMGILSWKGIIAGSMIGFIILVFAKLTEGKIGYGDGWVMAVTGLYLGFKENFILLLTSLFLTSLVSIVLLLLRKANRKTELPFVSFLFVGYVVMHTVLK